MVEEGEREMGTKVRGVERNHLSKASVMGTNRTLNSFACFDRTQCCHFVFNILAFSPIYLFLYFFSSSMGRSKT